MLVLMRIVAETGICAIQFLLPMYRPWQYLFRLVPSIAAQDSTLKPYFLACYFNVFFTVTQRENIAVLASHSIRMADVAAPVASKKRWQGLGVVAASAAGVGRRLFPPPAASLLYYEYKYSATLDAVGSAPVNAYGVGASATYALDDASRLMELRAPRPQTFNPVVHLLTGAGITAALAAMTLRFAWWPIHPLGYLLLFSWTTWVIWFSVMIGWLAKTCILRLGGKPALSRQPAAVHRPGAWRVRGNGFLADGQPDLRGLRLEVSRDQHTAVLISDAARAMCEYENKSARTDL